MKGKTVPARGARAEDAVRPARREEAGDIARLFLLSSDGLAAFIWGRMAEPGQSLAELGAARYARSGTAFSFENCLVAIRDGCIAGMVHSFPMAPDSSGGDEPDPVLRPYAELEDPGSLYVSGLAVHEGFRRRGLGKALMRHAERRARRLGLPRISLICFERNEVAYGFYRQGGFREIDRRAVVPHPTLHYRDGDAVLLCRPVA